MGKFVLRQQDDKCNHEFVDINTLLYIHQNNPSSLTKDPLYRL